MKNNLEHFLELARRGKYGGASGGAIRANLLAEAVLKHVPGLDASALAGLIFFITEAKQRPQATAELLRDGGSTNA